jgi:hypothetical protein
MNKANIITNSGIERFKSEANKDPNFVLYNFGTISHIIYEEMKYAVYKAVKDKSINIEQETQKILDMYSFNDEMKKYMKEWNIEIFRQRAIEWYNKSYIPQPITNYCPWCFDVYYDGVPTTMNNDFNELG